jgi:hypothetical protein
MDQSASPGRTSLPAFQESAGSRARAALAALVHAFDRDAALEARVAASPGRFSTVTFPPHEVPEHAPVGRLAWW